MPAKPPNEATSYILNSPPLRQRQAEMTLGSSGPCSCPVTWYRWSARESMPLPLSLPPCDSGSTVFQAPNDAVMTTSPSPVEPKVLLDGLTMVESPRWHDGRLWFAHWGTGEIRAVDLDGNSEVKGHGPVPGAFPPAARGLKGWARMPFAWTRRARSGGGRETPGSPPAATIRPVAPSPASEKVVRSWTGSNTTARFWGCALGGSDRRALFLVATEWRGTDQLDNVLAKHTGQVLTVQAPAPGVGWP